MTWVNERTQGTAVDEKARDTLLAKRFKLELEVLEVRDAPLRNKTQSAITGRQEDLMALAKKIKAIDKKLGRDVS